MKALIVDAEELFRLSLKEVISAAGNFSGILEADSEHTFLSTTAGESELDLIIMHPKSLGADGISCLSLARRLYPKAGIVAFLDAGETQPKGPEMDRVTFLTRGSSIHKVVQAIRSLLHLPDQQAVNANVGKPDVAVALAASNDRYRVAPAGDADIARLSYRQKQILSMAADGLPNKEIAARLSIAEGTVKAHMHAIFKVLGVSNRTQAVIRYGTPRREHSTPSTPQQSWQRNEPRAGY